MGNVKTSFQTMRIIVSTGRCICPLGYFFDYLMGSVPADSLNLIYNITDFINKIAFCLAIWHCAKKGTMENGESAISFWMISIAMVAATVFFLMESTAVSFHWITVP